MAFTEANQNKKAGIAQVKEVRKFAAETVLKMIADVLVRFRSLIVIPCLTAAYGVKEYGIWILIDSAVQLFSQLLTFRLEAAIIRFLPECKGDKELMRRHFGTLFYSTVVLGTLVILITTPARELMAELLFADGSLKIFVPLTFTWVLFRSVFVVSIAYLRARKRIKEYLALDLLTQASVVAIIVLISLGGYEFDTLLSITVVSSGVFAFFVLCFVVAEVGFPSWSAVSAKRYYAFSVPMIPLNMMRWVVNTSDRFFVAHFVSLQYAGYYGVCYSVGSVVAFISGPIYFVLFPYISDMWVRKETIGVIQYLHYTGKFYLMSALLLVVLLYSSADPIIMFLARQKIPYGSLMILLVAVGSIMASCYQRRIYVIYLMEKTKILLIPFVSGTLINVLGNYLLIRKMGIVGGAISTIVTFATIYIIIFFLTRNFFERTQDHYFAGKLFAAFLVTGLVLHFYPPADLWEAALSSILGGILYVGLAYLFRVVKKGELRFLVKIIRGTG